MAKAFYETCKPNAFLDPTLFATPFDDTVANRGYDVEQYNRGLEYGKKCTHISIGFDGVWSYRMKNGDMGVACERIGYHACTAYLLWGFLDSGCAIWVYREGREPTRIQ